MTFLHRNIACNYCVAFFIVRKREDEKKINGSFTRHLQCVFQLPHARLPEKIFRSFPAKTISSDVALSQMKDRSLPYTCTCFSRRRTGGMMDEC